MANEQNLKPVRTKKEARERRKKWRYKIGRIKGKKKEFKRRIIANFKPKRWR